MSGSGAGSEGPFGLTVTVGSVEVDVHAMDLAEGDVLGALVDGGAEWSACSTRS